MIDVLCMCWDHERSEEMVTPMYLTLVLGVMRCPFSESERGGYREEQVMGKYCVETD